MIRPYVHIYKTSKKDFAQARVKGSTDVFDESKITRLKPEIVEIKETRKGVFCTITTKHTKYNIKQGDVFLISLGYYTIKESKTTLPYMVVTSVQLNESGSFIIELTDEFSYCSQITNFIPSDLIITEEQTKFLKENFAYPNSTIRNTIAEKVEVINSETNKEKKKELEEGLKTFYDNQGLVINPDLKIGKLLKYILSVLKEKTAFEIELSPLMESAILNQTTGAWSGANAFTKVSEVIEKIRTQYYTNIFMTSGSIYEDWSPRKYLRVATLYNATPPEMSEKFQFKYLYGINLAEDSLVYKSAADEKLSVKGTFINEPLNKKKTNTAKTGTVVEKNKQTLIAYYEKNGEVKIWNSIKDKGKVVANDSVFNELNIKSARILSLEDRIDLVKKRLLSVSYTGYTGSLKSFNYNTNVFDRVVIVQKYNPISEDPLSFQYGIKEISRSYSNGGGLLTNYFIRQQLNFPK
jgi:hypothetical protein